MRARACVCVCVCVCVWRSLMCSACMNNTHVRHAYHASLRRRLLIVYYMHACMHARVRTCMRGDWQDAMTGLQIALVLVLDTPTQRNIR